MLIIIKANHVEKYPRLTGVVHEIMAFGSKSRWGMDRKVAVQWVEKINEFGKIFWETKGVGTK